VRGSRASYVGGAHVADKYVSATILLLCFSLNLVILRAASAAKFASGIQLALPRLAHRSNFVAPRFSAAGGACLLRPASTANRAAKRNNESRRPPHHGQGTLQLGSVLAWRAFTAERAATNFAVRFSSVESGVTVAT
jgi:hypothetical protein